MTDWLGAGMNMTEPATCQHLSQPPDCPLIGWPPSGIIAGYNPESRLFEKPDAYQCKLCGARWKPDGTAISADFQPSG